MSRSGRRREQGHPAKIAARREREQAKRKPKSPVESFCSLGAQLESAIEAELFVSEMLGILWGDRGLESPADHERELGTALLDGVAAYGGVGAAIILAGMREIASPDLAVRAGELADELTKAGMPPPDWADEIGSAEPVRTAVMGETIFDDGSTYFIESVRGGGERETIGIYVDNNLGRPVKDIMLADSIDDVIATIAAHPDEVAEVTMADAEPELVAARLRAAFDLTDRTIDPYVEEDYSSLRALALKRVGSLPEAEPDPGFEEVSVGEREDLLAEFLASDEGSGFVPGGEAARVVETAIDFCADSVDGRPLRWSPVVVEIFMASWLPRKVVAEEQFFEVVPDALAGWILFAARKRGQSADAVDLNFLAIDEYEDEMFAAVANPDSAGPGARLMAAMKEAGVDPTDEVALQTFIAGWNARSTLD